MGGIKVEELKKIWEILTTLSEESQKAARTKCKELGFDTNRGVISLDESLINLNNARNILTDAIEKEKLIQLPITVQKSLLSNLDTISKSLTGLIGGKDEVVNLADAIEQLNLSIWQYGFYNLSKEVLGYQKKLNQLKNAELEVKKLKEDLNGGLNLKSEVEKLVNETKKSNENLQAVLATSQENAKKILDYLNQTTEISQKAAATNAIIQQNENTSTKLLATTKTSNAEITALEGKIREFYGTIENSRSQIDAMTENSKKTVETNNSKTEELITRLRSLEDQIKDQIQKATGHSLFHSFQTRQQRLARTKWIWFASLILCAIVSIGWPGYVITHSSVMNTAFYLKLSLSIPILLLFWFCEAQYARERRLEEEYAFKANISISLVPYQDLISKLVSQDKPEEMQKYTAFIIDSVNKVFSSPLDRIFAKDKKQEELSEEVIKKVLSLTDPLLKFIK